MRPEKNLPSLSLKRRNSEYGFTLLEVLVAMTITGFALGALLSVIGGNKRLAWRSEDALVEASRVRVEINLAQLQDTPGEVPREEPPRDLRTDSDQQLETPERKTQAMSYALRGYDVRDASGEVLSHGVYWLQLTRPE
jgi:prepilin-type N-terminal cleavage/methylation domain-containing protein